MGVTAFSFTNAMEKSKYNNQAIRDYDGDNVGTGKQYKTMIMTADSRGAGQPSSGVESFGERLPDTSCLQHASLPSIRSGRRDVSFKRRQRFPLDTLGYVLILVASLWIMPASAAMIGFQNCLSESYQNNVPLQLQFVPLFFDAVFDTENTMHNLRVTVYGNVTGSGPGNIIPILPPLNDTDYWNSNQTGPGKIEDIPDPGVDKLTTLFNKVNVLTYQPWNESTDFCGRLVNISCPLAPVFNKSG